MARVKIDSLVRTLNRMGGSMSYSSCWRQIDGSVVVGKIGAPETMTTVRGSDPSILLAALYRLSDARQRLRRVIENLADPLGISVWEKP